ncbi:MAG TPA: hypothetical protein VIS72_10200 [Anaerolineales bacterium]
MPYEPFYERFRELALNETRSFTVDEGNYPGLPADEYALLEAYCNDKNCDCRRVFFNVVSRKRQDIMAVVTYGWESEAFYRKWYGGGNDELTRMAVSEMMGLGLNSASPQSRVAPALLAPIRDILLDDPAYVARLKRHYQIFKEKVDPKNFRKTAAEKRVVAEKPKSKKRRRK